MRMNVKKTSHRQNRFMLYRSIYVVHLIEIEPELSLMENEARLALIKQSLFIFVSSLLVIGIDC